MARDWYDSFDEYVKDFPQAEHYRVWVCGRTPSKFRLGADKRVADWWNNRKQSVVLFRGTGMHAGLPGGYLWGRALQYAQPHFKSGYDRHVARVLMNEWDNVSPRVDVAPSLAIFCDSDDGMIRKECVSYEEALEYLEWAKTQAPVSMSEIADCFSFSW